jgi:hypothetical protein
MTQVGKPTVQPSTAAPLTADERDELLRLRRELETIRTDRRPRPAFR